jgi:hypothetical protein
MVSAKQAGRPAEDFQERVEEDLVNAARSLHFSAVGSEISVALSPQDPAAGGILERAERIRAAGRLTPGDGLHPEPVMEKERLAFLVSAHPVVAPEQEKLREREWKSVTQSILSRKNSINGLSQTIDNELRVLVDSFRRRMDLAGKVSQTFSAFLNVLPATVAVTYIFHTGDPVGAAGIKVKLSGLFGLHDLYALFAIPATTGLKKADLKQLEGLLAPIAQAWFNDKLAIIQKIFEQEITSGIMGVADDVIDVSEQLLKAIETSIQICEKAMIAT